MTTLPALEVTMFESCERNGVEVQLSRHGFFEAVRPCGDADWVYPGQPEFQALVAQFNGQSYSGTAW